MSRDVLLILDWLLGYSICDSFCCYIWEARLCGTMVRLPKDLRYESDQSLRENCTLGLRNWTDTLAPKKPMMMQFGRGWEAEGRRELHNFRPPEPHLRRENVRQQGVGVELCSRTVAWPERSEREAVCAILVLRVRLPLVQYQGMLWSDIGR